MTESKLHHFFSGIGFAACAIGLLLLGLAFGASLSGETGFSDHMLFMPGLSCIGAGMLSLVIISLASTDSSDS